MFVKGAVTGQLTRTAGPWSSVLKSQPHPCRIHGLQRSELASQSWQGDLESSNESGSEEPNPNVSPPPTLRHFCGN